MSIKGFVTAFGSFLIIDFIWLNFVAKNFYFERMQHVGNIIDGKIKISLMPGLFVYVLLALGITYFVLPKSSNNDTFYSVFVSGAILGLVIYGVYDLTNMATLKSWPLSLALADVAWGAVATGVVSYISFSVLK